MAPENKALIDKDDKEQCKAIYLKTKKTNLFQTLSGFSKERKREAITPGLKSWGHINTSNTSYHVGHLLSLLLDFCLFLSNFNKGPGVKSISYKRISHIAGFF